MPLQALADAIQDPMASTYIRDSAGTIVYANDRFYHVMGTSRDVVLGKTTAEVFGRTGDAASWANTDALVFATHSPLVTVEYRQGQAYVVLKTMITGHDGKSYLLVSGVPTPTPAKMEEETRVANLELRLLAYISNENEYRLQEGGATTPFNRLSVAEQEPLVSALDRLTARIREMSLQVDIRGSATERQIKMIYRLAWLVAGILMVDTIFGLFWH